MESDRNLIDNNENAPEQEYKYRTVRTVYGNGQVSTYTRAIPVGGSDPDEEEAVDRDEENRRIRNANTRKRWMTIANSADLPYCATFSTTDPTLKNDIKAFRKAVKTYLKKKHPGIKAAGIAEYFDNPDRGIHFHILSDCPVDLAEWIALHGDISGEYSAPIYSSQYNATNYPKKKIGQTKDKAGKGVHIFFKLNIERIEPERTIYLTDVDGNNSEIVYENHAAHTARLEAEAEIAVDPCPVDEAEVCAVSDPVPYPVADPCPVLPPSGRPGCAALAAPSVGGADPCIGALPAVRPGCAPLAAVPSGEVATGIDRVVFYPVLCPDIQKRYIWEETPATRKNNSKKTAHGSNTGVYIAPVLSCTRLFINISSWIIRYLAWIYHIPDR